MRIRGDLHLFPCAAEVPAGFPTEVDAIAPGLAVLLQEDGEQHHLNPGLLLGLVDGELVWIRPDAFE